jgi:hypothetical protein
LSEEDSQKVYDRYHVPTPASWLWAYGVFANITPGHQRTIVSGTVDMAASFRRRRTSLHLTLQEQ